MVNRHVAFECQPRTRITDRSSAAASDELAIISPTASVVVHDWRLIVLDEAPGACCRSALQHRGGRIMSTQPLQDSADRRTQLAADRGPSPLSAPTPPGSGPASPRWPAAWVQKASGGGDPRVGPLGGRHRPGAVQRLLLWRGDLASGVPRTASAPARHAADPAALLVLVNGFLVLVALSAP